LLSLNFFLCTLLSVICFYCRRARDAVVVIARIYVSSFAWGYDSGEGVQRGAFWVVGQWAGVPFSRSRHHINKTEQQSVSRCCCQRYWL